MTLFLAYFVLIPHMLSNTNFYSTYWGGEKLVPNHEYIIYHKIPNSFYAKGLLI